MSNCGKCHTCGTTLRNVLDGEEWCNTCKQYRRYQSHGWNSSCENSPCPGIEIPTWLHSDLMTCFKLKESDKYPGFFPIWNDTTNNWLIKSLGIFTDDEAIFTKLNDAFTVVFDWHIQRFCVGAGEPL